MTRFDQEMWICDVQSTIEMKGGSQPAGNTTTTTTNTPWSGQQDYLTDVYKKAQNIGNTQLTPPPFPTYLDPNQNQIAAVGMEQNRAVNGSPINSANSNQLTSTLNGDYLNSGNPAFQNMVNQVGQAIAPQVDSHFAANGRYGSGANANAFASAMANTAGNLAFQNYGNERQNQLRASLLAPDAANQDYTDIAHLANAGNTQYGMNMMPLQDAINKYQFSQDAPYIQANREAALVGGAIPGGGTVTSPYFNNPTANMLGTGLGILGGANMLFGGSGMNGTGPSLFSRMGSGIGSIFK